MHDIGHFSSEQKAAAWLAISRLMDERLVSRHYKRKVEAAIYRGDLSAIYLNIRRLGVERSHVDAILTLIKG